MKNLNITIKEIYPEADVIAKKIIEDNAFLTSKKNNDYSLTFTLKDIERFYCSENKETSFFNCFNLWLIDNITNKVESIISCNDIPIDNLQHLSHDVSNQCIVGMPQDIKKLAMLITRLEKDKNIVFFKIDIHHEIMNAFLISLINYLEHITNCLNEIIYRLSIDKLELGFPHSTGVLKKISLSLGDNHHHGKSVSLLLFKNKSYVYKPRSADNESICQTLLDIVKNKVPSINIGIPFFINKKLYSWHEHIEFKDCMDINSCYEYYYNIGAAISFFCTFRGTDFHYENIICKSITPYFVDLECVFFGYPRENIFSNTVLNTNIIPSLSGSVIEEFICGIGRKDNDGNFIYKKTFDFDSSGAIKCIKEGKGIPNDANRPVLFFNQLNYGEIKRRIISGYKKMEDAITYTLPFLIGELEKKKNITSRVLFRTSKYYSDIISMVSHPRYAIDLPAKALAIACAIDKESIPIDVLKDEFNTLMQGRIPHYQYDIKRQVLVSCNDIEIKKPSNFCNLPEILKEIKMTKNNEEYIKFQEHLLKTSLDFLFYEKQTNNKPTDIGKVIKHIHDEHVILNGNKYRLNVKTGNNETRLISEMKSDIYNGYAGVVFLQLCKYTIFKSHSNLQFTIKMYHELVNLHGEKIYEGIGVYEKSGSLIYIDYLLYKLTGNKLYFDKFSLHLDGVILNLESHLKIKSDIISGVSGLLIICTRMYKLSTSPKILKAIVFFTNVILKNKVKINNLQNSWDNLWSGFAHGNSGILYTLTLADNILHSKEVSLAIINGLRYEHSLKIGCGWKDLRLRKADTDFNSWCHGASGIYLARISMLNETTSKDEEFISFLKSDIKHYFETSKLRLENQHESLCHGMYGNAIINNHINRDLACMKFNKDTLLEEKSLMTGKLGGYYSALYFKGKSLDLDIPNILTLS